jgi:hypothetical protein
MKDKLISFETAKLAKVIGFNEECINYFSHKGVSSKTFNISKNHTFSKVEGLKPAKHNNKSSTTSMPTQSLLQRWLREKYKIGIVLLPDTGFKSNLKWGGGLVRLDLNNSGGCISFELDKVIGTYEEALEELLQEALKQIK